MSDLPLGVEVVLSRLSWSSSRVANKCFLENPAFFVKITAYFQPPKSEKDIIFQPIKKILYKKPAHVFVKYNTIFKELFIENQLNFKLLKLSYNEKQ